MPTTNTKIQRSVILVGGDKGGVGKSAVARALSDYLYAHGRDHIAYDGDDVNPTFLRFFPKAERLYTKSVKGFEPLINNLESETPCQLVDLGGGTSIMLGKFADHTGFIALAEKMGAKIALMFVLAPGVDSVNLLKIISEQYGNRLQYIIARSEAIPGNWDLWQGSKTREKLLAAGATEITIPALDPDAFSAVDRYSLGWRVAASDRRLTLASRAKVFRWIEKVHGEFDRVAEILLP